MCLKTLESGEGGGAGAGEGAPTRLLMHLQVDLRAELLLTIWTWQGFGCMNFHIVLLQKFEGLEVVALVGLCYVVLASHHGAKEGWWEGGRGGQPLEHDVLAHQHLRLPVHL